MSAHFFVQRLGNDSYPKADDGAIVRAQTAAHAAALFGARDFASGLVVVAYELGPEQRFKIDLTATDIGEALTATAERAP